MSTIEEDEEPQRPTAQSADTAQTTPKDDKMDNAAQLNNTKTFPEDSVAALVDMQVQIIYVYISLDGSSLSLPISLRIYNFLSDQHNNAFCLIFNSVSEDHFKLMFSFLDSLFPPD